jgi:intracellular septation protein
MPATSREKRSRARSTRGANATVHGQLRYPMQLLADYFPLLLFFLAFKLQGIYVATAVAIAASVAQIAWFHWRGKVTAVHWLSLAIIVVFGGATLLLHDEVFIKWKPTVLYGLFGAVLAGGKVLFRRDLIAFLLKDVTLPASVWTRVTWSWVLFFAAMAVINWYVAFNFSTETWVNFKVWGGIGLFLAFALAQGLALSRYVSDAP